MVWIQNTHHLNFDYRALICLSSHSAQIASPNIARRLYRNYSDVRDHQTINKKSGATTSFPSKATGTGISAHSNGLPVSLITKHKFCLYISSKVGKNHNKTKMSTVIGFISLGITVVKNTLNFVSVEGLSGVSTHSYRQVASSLFFPFSSLLNTHATSWFQCLICLKVTICSLTFIPDVSFTLLLFVFVVSLPILKPKEYNTHYSFLRYFENSWCCRR